MSKPDPKLTRTSVQIRYSSDDGYRSDFGVRSGARTSSPAQPRAALIEGLHELARLLELFGFGDEAQNALTNARAAVQDWRKKSPNGEAS